jgi:WD40 repeat protein
MALSRDGHFAATVGSDSWQLYDLRDGREVRAPTPVTQGRAPVFSADGTKLAIGGQVANRSIYASTQGPSYRAFVFDTTREDRPIEYPLAGEVQSLALTRGGRFLVAGDAGAARVWDLADGSEPVRMTTGSLLASVAISDDARVVVTAGADGTTRAFDTQDGSEIARVTHECVTGAVGAAASASAAQSKPCQVRAVAVSADGRVVFSGGDDAVLRAVETLGANEVARITEDLPITGVALTRDGRRLAIGSGHIEASRLRVFDYPEWREHQFEPPRPEVKSLALSANGRFGAVTSNWFGGPWIFDLEAPGKPARELGGPSLMSSVALSNDGSAAAWISNSQAMRFDPASGKVVTIPDVPFAQAIALSDDGGTAAVAAGTLGANDNAVFVAHFSSAGPPTRVSFTRPMLYVSISGDGHWVAASAGEQSLDGVVHVIDATAGREHWQHVGARNTPVAFTRDGGTTAMASADGTLRTFDTATGQETFRTALEQPIAGLAFDEPGGALLAASLTRTIAGGSGFTVKRYLLRRDDVIAHACARMRRNLTGAEWRRYVGADAPYSATCEMAR